jgi:hypothetical protein
VHDAGELHYVLHEHLGAAGDAAARNVLWQFVAQGRFLDVGLLDQLLELAGPSIRRPPRPTLRQLAGQHGGMTLRAEDELRQLVAAGTSGATADAQSALAAEAALHAQGIVRVFDALHGQLRTVDLGLDQEGGAARWDWPSRSRATSRRPTSGVTASGSRLGRCTRSSRPASRHATGARRCS